MRLVINNLPFFFYLSIQKIEKTFVKNRCPDNNNNNYCNNYLTHY